MGGALALRLNILRLHPNPRRLRVRKDRRLRPIRPSHRDELNYRDRLNSIVNRLRKLGKHVTEQLRSEWPKQAADGSPFVGDGEEKKVPRKMRDLVDTARNVGAVSDIEAHTIAGVTVQMNLQTVDGRLTAAVQRSLGIDLRQVLADKSDVTDELARSRRANVELIQSIPSQYFDKIDDAIDEHWTEESSFDDLADRIEEIGDVTESRAALIARDQTSKMNSSFNRVRQTSIGIQQYEWQTAQDERVRDSHAELDGQTFDWDNPPVVDGEVANPGEPINCRCIAAPVVDLDDDDQQDDGDDDLAEAA